MSNESASHIQSACVLENSGSMGTVSPVALFLGYGSTKSASGVPVPVSRALAVNITAPDLLTVSCVPADCGVTGCAYADHAVHVHRSRVKL